MHIAMLLHKSVEFDSRVRREASALAAGGHRVTVLELAAVPGPGGVATLDGFTRRSCQPPAWVRRVLPFHLYRVAFLASFVRGLTRLRPDVIHAHDAAMLLPGIVGARLTGARLLYDSHELATGVPYRERAWTSFVAGIERLVVPRCAAVITVSDGIAERLRQRYRLAGTPVVVRNVSALRPGDGARGGDVREEDGPREQSPREEGPREGRSRRGGLRERLGIDRETPLILHQGAPAPARGCRVLVAAVAQLPDARLVFLGDPEPGYGAALRNIVRDHRMQHRVALLPSVPLDDLLAHTAEADVGVTLLQDTCENHRLALPNKLFEYIAAGVPVIASALPEIQRLVERHGVGWCVPPDDPDALARALSVAVAQRRDPILRARLDRAARELSWSRERRRLLELYARLASRPGSSRPRDDQAVSAQRGHAGERPVQTPRPPSQWGQERDRAHRQPLAERPAQLARGDQAGVPVGSGDARLPDRDDPRRGQHAPRLGESRPHVRAGADRG